jgi:hypothetical protein
MRVIIRLSGVPHRSDSVFTSPEPFGKSRMLSGLDPIPGSDPGPASGI